MSGGFNRYAEWLEIAEHIRQPNHYELLGLPLFENNQERIKNNYWQRFEHVRKYEVGSYSEEAIPLLEELSQAFQCLTHAEAKRQYDEKLRQDRAQSTTVSDLALVETLAEVPHAESFQPPSAAAQNEHQPAPTPFEPIEIPTAWGRPVVLAGAGVTGVLALAILVMLLYGGASDAAPEVTQHAPAEDPAATAPGAPTSAPADSDGASAPAFKAGADDSAVASDAESTADETPASEKPEITFGASAESTPFSGVGAFGSPATAAPVALAEDQSPDATEAPVNEDKTPNDKTEPDAVASANATSDPPSEESPSPPAEDDPADAQPAFDPNAPTADQYTFPSEAVLNIEELLVDPDDLMDQTGAQTRQGAYLVTLLHEGSAEALRAIAGFDPRNRLHGLCVELYPDQEMMRAAYYKNGSRNGRMWAWNRSGDLTFTAEYINGRMDNFCCLFSQRRLRLVLEYNKGQLLGVHTIAGPQIARSYPSIEAVPADDALTRDLLAALEETQTKVDEGVAALKRQIRDEARDMTTAQRGELAAQRSALLRGLIQAKENQRRAVNQQHINGLRRRTGL